MLDHMRAADLPIGSVVADDTRAWIKTERPDDPLYCWQPGGWSNAQIDQQCRHGAQVLRVGNDTEDAK